MAAAARRGLRCRSPILKAKFLSFTCPATGLAVEARDRSWPELSGFSAVRCPACGSTHLLPSGAPAEDAAASQLGSGKVR